VTDPSIDISPAGINSERQNAVAFQRSSDRGISMYLLAASCKELDGHGVIVAWSCLTFFVKFKIEGVLKRGT